MKDVLKSIILEFQQRELPQLFRRNLTINSEIPVIISLIGARRSGKTYMLYQVMNELIRKGINRENILYLNFEDERLMMQISDLDYILQAYAELYPDKGLSECYLFFDEIQNVNGWEKFIRRIFDNYTKHIFITGSNAKLLSTEIADSLRGRTLTYTVYPLSFDEYLRFINVDYELINPQNKSKVIHYALQFIKMGGFPEVIHFPDEERVKVLQSYFNSMIFRDIVERYKINDVQVLKFFIKKLFANVGTPLSVNRIYNDLRSMGYKISNNYLYEFEQHVYSVFLGISVPKFDYSEIKQAKSEKKMYVIDSGLLSAIEFTLSLNRGKLLENTILTELVKSGFEVFYYKDKYECDFIVKKDAGIFPLQVSWQIENPATRDREIRALLEFCKNNNLNKAQLITFDQKQHFNANGVEIQIMPFYEWARDIKDLYR